MNTVIEPVALVLLPGMMCNGQLYKYQTGYFSQSRKVIVGDMRGSDSIRSMAERALEDAPEKFALAGLSMGGIVALEIIRLAPQRVDRLALLDTNPGSELPLHREHRRRNMETIQQGGIAALQTLIDEFFFPRYVADSHLHDESLKTCVLSMATGAGVETFLSQSRALMDRADSWLTLAEIGCPTLVLCGDQDVLCPPAVHVEMAKHIKGSHLEIIADCGHLSTLEKPDDVNHVLQRWLDDEENK